MRHRSPHRGALRQPDETDKTVGRNIRMLRLKRKQTLNDLAGALGVSHQQLQKYETGENRLTVGMAAKAADRLAVPVEHLFRKASVQTDKETDRETRLIEDLRQEGVCYLAKATTPEALQRMVGVLKAMSS